MIFQRTSGRSRIRVVLASLVGAVLGTILFQPSLSSQYVWSNASCNSTCPQSEGIDCWNACGPEPTDCSCDCFVERSLWGSCRARCDYQPDYDDYCKWDPMPPGP